MLLRPTLVARLSVSQLRLWLVATVRLLRLWLPTLSLLWVSALVIPPPRHRTETKKSEADQARTQRRHGPAHETVSKVTTLWPAPHQGSGAGSAPIIKLDIAAPIADATIRPKPNACLLS